ncbi:TIGR03621 family F420-dependent LLM class oxidoreductase [Streptomyces sp. DSM 44915]|uniref:TIGR03621 family F420-dependent LLM class oxidoreductase n=1 Tax=Streptomyces chisholmiae TaxID=3075540 RepID=A0ABU2JLZ4_9ACTN|nr:TIGR03621 family F420-dependent LLM class oxidoreductase [Streptomyces sp. DSM 44915]MDT0266006.1 TIGR03621 family F420-dependent LLM class oxidoreductase [Streptomyces sp. DSM 44915]
MRPFRFLTSVGEPYDGPGLAAFARRAESLGYSAVVIPDHLGTDHAPVPLLSAVAAVTERLRVGTFVFNNNLRHPAVLAQELATLDRLSDGRVEIGLGAGWNRPEHDAIGLPFEPVGTRVARLAESIRVLKGCFGEEPFSCRGEHYTITDFDALPKPVQRPHPPFFVGGGGKRLLTLAAKEAQIIGLAPRIGRDGKGLPTLDTPSITVAATEEKVRWIREAAGDRFPELELNTYPTGGPMVVTADARGEARRRADALRARTGVELTVGEILESPHVFIGSVRELTQKLLDLRERLGISSFLLDETEAAAPIVAALAGR